MVPAGLLVCGKGKMKEKKIDIFINVNNGTVLTHDPKLRAWGRMEGRA